MGKPCSVCTHSERAKIDVDLSRQVVNLSQIGRLYGLGHDAVRNHRLRHLPEFLPAFQAAADALPLTAVQAEAQRLYLISLDALARAEAGTLIEVGEDGTEHRKVSSTAVAAMMRECRQALGMLAGLALDAPAQDAVAPGSSNAALDDRIGAALARAQQRALPSPGTVGAANVGTTSDPAHRVSGSAAIDQAARVGGQGGTPGPGSGGVAGDSEVPRDTSTPSETSQGYETDITDAELVTDIDPAQEWGENPRDKQIRLAAAAGEHYSPATTDDELRAAGFAL